MRRSESDLRSCRKLPPVLHVSVAAATSATASAVTAAVVVATPATATTAVTVEKENGDKNDPEALVVLENVT